MARHREHSGIALAAAIAAMVAGVGCGSAETTSGSGGSTGATTSGGSGGGEVDCSAPDDPPAPSADWCDRFTAGPKGAKSAAVDLSAAHAHVRFFGPVESYTQADQALAAALVSDDALAGKDLSAYVAALPGVACAGVPNDATLGAAAVTMEGDVAIVTPGTGAVELPAGTKAVLVDLREVPAVEGARDAILAAIAPALAMPVLGLVEHVRQHNGMVDEVFSATNVYTNKVTTQPLPEIPAAGAEELPLALLTDADLSPDAAEIAATLRFANRAWIVGVDLRAEVAESRWQGVGETGVQYRYRDLYLGAGWVQDVIEADREMSQPQCFASQILEQGAVPPFAGGPADRPKVLKMSPFGVQQPPTDPLGDARAALVIAHGAARLFYPYFPTVGDIIDARLDETLAALPAAPTRKDELSALRRFGEALTDGHNFVFDNDPMTAGYFPVYIEDIDGLPVVRRSAAPGVVAGDTITSIDGVPVADWYEVELARSGGATPGYKFNIATRQFIRMSGPMDFGIQDVGGAQKTVTVQPQPVDDYLAILVATGRTAGFLDDLGAPNLYYINMHNSIMKDLVAFKAALTEAQPATGLVVDMRGYPGIDHYDAARRLVQTAFSSPIFNVPVYKGPDALSIDESSYPMSPAFSPNYTGPIAFIVGHSTVSAAENFSIMLVDANRVRVFGRQSAGTNGNITGVEAPGDFEFSFTGMEVLHADDKKSQFHGIGIVPEKETLLSADDFANGVDPELEEAVTWLLMQ